MATLVSTPRTLLSGRGGGWQGCFPRPASPTEDRDRLRQLARVAAAPPRHGRYGRCLASRRRAGRRGPALADRAGTPRLVRLPRLGAPDPGARRSARHRAACRRRLGLRALPGGDDPGRPSADADRHADPLRGRRGRWLERRAARLSAPTGEASAIRACNARAHSVLSMPASNSCRFRVLQVQRTGPIRECACLKRTRRGVMAGDAFVTGWGISLPNAPVYNAQIEAVLGHIEAQSAAVKRRVLIMHLDPALCHRPGDRPDHPHQCATDRRGGSRPVPECRHRAQGHRLPRPWASSADQVIPSHASMVHAELKTPPCEIISPTGSPPRRRVRIEVRRPQRRLGASAQRRRHRLQLPRRASALAFRAPDSGSMSARSTTTRCCPSRTSSCAGCSRTALARCSSSLNRARTGRLVLHLLDDLYLIRQRVRITGCISACRRARTAPLRAGARSTTRHGLGVAVIQPVGGRRVPQ